MYCQVWGCCLPQYVDDAGPIGIKKNKGLEGNVLTMLMIPRGKFDEWASSEL